MKRFFRPNDLIALGEEHGFNYHKYEYLGNPFYKRHREEKIPKKAKREYQTYLLTSPNAKEQFKILKALSDFDFMINELGGRITTKDIDQVINAKHILSFPVILVTHLNKELDAIKETWNEQENFEQFDSKFNKLDHLNQAIKILNTPGYDIPVLSPEVLEDVQRISISIQ